MQILKKEGVFRLYDRNTSLILTDEKQLKRIAENPDKPLFDDEERGFSGEKKGLYPPGTTLDSFMKDAKDRGCERVEISYDFFFGGSKRENYPDDELTMRAYKVICESAKKYGMSFGASALSPLDVGGGYAKRHDDIGYTWQMDASHEFEVVFVRLPRGVFAALAPGGDLCLYVLDACHRVGLAQLLRNAGVVKINAVDGAIKRADDLVAELPKVRARRRRQVYARELNAAGTRRGTRDHVGEICADVADSDDYTRVGKLQLLPILGCIELAADAGGEGRDWKLEVAAHVRGTVTVDLNEAVKLRHRRGPEAVDDFGFGKRRKQYGGNESQG